MMNFPATLAPFAHAPFLAETSPSHPATGGWVPSAPLLADIVDKVFTPEALVFTVIVVVLAVAGYLGAMKLRKEVMADISRALGLKEEVQLKQPITIRREMVYVSQEVFSTEMEKIAGRFMGMEKQIATQVAITDKYLHEFRHELKNELAAAALKAEEREHRITEAISHQSELTSESVGKVHTRVDSVAQSLGEVRGEIRQMTIAIQAQQGGRRS